MITKPAPVAMLNELRVSLAILAQRGLDERVATRPLSSFAPPRDRRYTAQRIIEAMRLPVEPPALAPARPPPQPRLPFAE